MITESDEVSTARDRLQGYREALEAAEIAFLPELVVETSTVDPRLACQATLDLLDLAETPTALFAVNNIAVIGVAEAARARSLEIPRDIAVVCFDEVDYASRFHPFLTVMSQPAETFGTIATQLLLDRLAGRVAERRRVVVLPADLVVRESCGAQLPVS
jgi:LacI family transcriptional regulator